MVELKHVKTIKFISFIIIALGFITMGLVLSAMDSLVLVLSAFSFFNAGLNMELTFLIVPAVVLLLLRARMVKLEISLQVTRILSCLSLLMIVIYLIFVDVGIIQPYLKPGVELPSFVAVFVLFIIMFAVEGFLYFVIFWAASKDVARASSP